jgi:hypothetical protein
MRQDVTPTNAIPGVTSLIVVRPPDADALSRYGGTVQLWRGISLS